MSQVNDAWSWGQESSETNEDNSGSTDPIDWDDNSWGTSWDNNEIIQTEQQSETFNNEKCHKVEQISSKIYATLQSQIKNQNQNAIFQTNVNSYDENTQQTQVMDNHNYNENHYSTNYKDQYQQQQQPPPQQQQRYTDHDNDNFNYTQQITTPSDPLLTMNHHKGQSYNLQQSGYNDYVDQNCTQYNVSVVPNNESYQNCNIVGVHYNQNGWFNPAAQEQTSQDRFQENQMLNNQVQTVVNSAGENGSLFVPVSFNLENTPRGVSKINVPFHEGPSDLSSNGEENNELGTYYSIDNIQPTPGVSLEGSNKNSWYEDYENNSVVHSSHAQSSDNFITNNEEQTSPSEEKKKSHTSSAELKNSLVIEEHSVYNNNNNNNYTDHTIQVKSELSDSIDNSLRVEETESKKCVIQHELTDENTNIMHSSNFLEGNKDTSNIEQTANNNQPCEVQNESSLVNVVGESIELGNVENNVSQEANSEEKEVAPILLHRNFTASPYDNLCQDISEENLEDKVKHSPREIDRNTKPNNKNMVHNLTTNGEDKSTEITNRLMSGPKKYMDLSSSKEDQTKEINVEKRNAVPLNENSVASEKLSKLKRSTEKTTKDRNQYLETGELQDSRSLSDDTDDNDDEAPNFVRMIPGSEMSDPNMTQPNPSSRQTNTSDSGNKASGGIPTIRKHPKSKRHTPRSPSPPQSDSMEEEEEEDKVDDKKLMKIIKTIMSEDKAKKSKAKKNGKENLETTALRIAKILKAQKQGSSKLEDSDEDHNSSLDSKPPLPTGKSNPRLTDFEKYMNSLSRRKQDRERSAKPALSASSPIPLEDRLSSMSIQDKAYPERSLQRPYPQRTPPSRPFPQRTPPTNVYPDRPFPQRTPPTNIYPDRPFPQRTPPIQTYPERSIKSPFTDISSLDRRQIRKSSGDSFASYGPFLAGILANFSSITKEQIDSMKRLSLEFPREYTAWYMGNYLPTWKKYKETLNERNTVIRNRMTKQFGKYCLGKFRLNALMKFEGSSIHEFNIDVQRLFHCFDDSNYLHEIELLTPFTFDNEDKKCFNGFIQSMIHRATSLSEQLLYQLIELMFRSKGEIELSDIGELLLRSYSKVKGTDFLRYPNTALWKPQNTEEENFKLRQHIVNNQKQKAFHLALQTKDWALATLLSTGSNNHFTRSEVHDAFLASLPANDPLRPCFQIMFDQSVELNSSTPVDLNEWGIHLAGILNNSTPETVDTAAILKLGQLLGNKGDHYGEQFCTLTVNAPWTRFKLLGAGCYDNLENVSLDTTVNGRNLLLSMAYENAAKLRSHDAGYQFVQLQYMKYHFALKLLRLGKSKMSLHFLHHAAEEILAHLGAFCTAKHLPLLGQIVDIVGVCAGSQAQDLLWYTQLQHVLSQYIPARCLQLPSLPQPEDLNPPPSPLIGSSTTQPEYASSFSNYGQYGGTQPQSARQTPISQAVGNVARFNTGGIPTGGNAISKPNALNPMSNSSGMNLIGNPTGVNPTGHPSSMNPLSNPIGMKPRGNSGAVNPPSDPIGVNPIYNPTGVKPIANTINPLDPKSAGPNPGNNLTRANTLPGSNPLRTSAFNKPPSNTLSNSMRPNPMRSNPSRGQRENIQAPPLSELNPQASQFFTPALNPDSESTYQQHLQDSESSTSMNQISLNSSFSYAAQDAQENDRTGEQHLSSKPNSAVASSGGWFGFLRKKPDPGPSTTGSVQQESSHPSGTQVNPRSRAPTPQQGHYPVPSYSAPPPSMMPPYPPELLHQSNVQSGFYQPQQQSYSRSSSPASSLSTEVRYYTSRRPSWNQHYR